ncbi:MAG: type II secretion system F family protein [Oryzihumus sp.]
MSAAVWGGLAGGCACAGLLLVCWRLVELRRPRLAVRVLPYLRDVPRSPGMLPHPTPVRATGAFGDLFGPLVGAAADLLDRVLGGSTSIRRRLERAGLDLDVRGFRVEQALWGLAGLAVAAAVSTVVALRSPGRTVPLLVLCAVAFVLGALLRENRLTAQVTARERRILAEFPTVAELLALSVAAGEGPVAALDRVVGRCRGELAADLGRVLADVRTGAPAARALDGLARRTGVPVVARFAEGMAIALERGTPLAAVLHAQVADVREAGRRALIESGARKEIVMMVPVVFLVLPVTVVFAFWPGVVGLNLVTP